MRQHESRALKIARKKNQVPGPEANKPARTAPGLHSCLAQPQQRWRNRPGSGSGCGNQNHGREGPERDSGTRTPAGTPGRGAEAEQSPGTRFASLCGAPGHVPAPSPARSRAALPQLRGLPGDRAQRGRAQPGAPRGPRPGPSPAPTEPGRGSAIPSAHREPRGGSASGAPRAAPSSDRGGTAAAAPPPLRAAGSRAGSRAVSRAGAGLEPGRAGRPRRLPGAGRAAAARARGPFRRAGGRGRPRAPRS